MIHLKSMHNPLNLCMDYIAFTSAWIDKLRETTCEDPVLGTVYQLVQHRWLKLRRRVPNVARYFWDFRDELTTDEGLLLKGPSLMIPAVLRESYLQCLHKGHLFAKKVNSNARQHMLWPGMEADINDYTRRCEICIKRSHSTREPLQPHDIPDGPWEKIRMDYFDFKGKSYILICDYFSKFPYMSQCKTSWGSLTLSVLIATKANQSKNPSCTSISSQQGNFNTANISLIWCYRTHLVFFH